MSLERARDVPRMSKDLNCLSLKEYDFACGHVLTVGRMFGGWLRQQSPETPLDRLQQYLRGGSFVLKVDVSTYFYSIDHAMLMESLGRIVASERTRALMQALLATYSAHSEYYFLQPADDLFDIAPRRGVPLGNLTSQSFANWYLQPVDDLV